MDAVPALRARCLYSKVPRFKMHQYYGFTKYADYLSYSVYMPIGIVGCYATRLLDECSVIVIEDNNGVIAVFEVC